MSDGVALITGSGGYLGRRLARHYLDTSDIELVLPVRTAARRAEIEATLGPHARRVLFIPGHLDGPEAFAEVDAAWRNRITCIIHAAAITKFNVDRELAGKVNVEGTAQVLALARRCRCLDSLAYVSTVYATGLREGPIGEEPTDDTAGFANAYEWSKWAGEQLVAGADDLPWRVLRVATVIADDDAGMVTQYNAFHETLKLCFYGLLSLLPGRADTPLYFVTGRFAVDAIVALAEPGGAGGIYHVSPDRTGALTLDQVLDLVFEQFGVEDDFAKKRIMRPLLADEESFDLLVAGVSPIAGGLVARALDNVAPFARQLYVNKNLDNNRLRGALDAYTLPDAAQLLANTCRRLLATRWGRRDAQR